MGWPLVPTFVLANQRRELAFGIHGGECIKLLVMSFQAGSKNGAITVDDAAKGVKVRAFVVCFQLRMWKLTVMVVWTSVGAPLRR